MSLKSRLKRVVKGVAYASGIPLTLKGALDTAPAQAIEAGQGPLIASAAVLGATAGPALAAELGTATGFASSAGEVATDIYATGGGMSLFSDILSYGQTAANIYSQVQSARAPTISNIASPMLTPTMGALPPIAGRALPMLAGAGALVVRGAASVARSAMTYCRRNPAWCASIGGTAAIAGLIESGQLPTIRRRRGRGITPRDLRSFKRVANLIRGFCPTVRRIPGRATRHVRGTGITHA